MSKLTKDNIEEINMLFKNGFTYEELAKKFGVSKGCIRYRIYPENKRPKGVIDSLSDADKEEILKLYASRQWDVIFDKYPQLKNKKSAVQGFARRNNVKMNSVVWTEEEKQFLIDNVELPVKELARLLNKTENSIRGQKTNLGIRSGKFKPFTDDEKCMIEEYYKINSDSIDLEELANKMGRQKTSICRYARKVGLTNHKRPMTENKYLSLTEKRHRLMETDYYKNVLLPKFIAAGQNIIQNPETHPRGMLGKHHTKEVCQIISEFNKKRAASMSKKEKHEIAMKAVKTKIKNRTLTNTTSNSYSRTKSGKRKDLNNQYFRSSWEANIARFLNYEYIEWQYEIKRFYFAKSVNGVASYQPDFYLPEFDKWIEVKGWMDEKSKTRLRLFEEQYPDEFSKLILIDENFYNELRDEMSYLIENWEYSTSEKKYVWIRSFMSEKAN